MKQPIVRGKEKLEYLPCEHFLQGFEIQSAFCRAEQVGENCGKIQNPVKIAHKADFLIFISLYNNQLFLILRNGGK